MDFGALPPEVNSGRMYAGAGPGPLLAAAAAWDELAAELRSAAASYGTVVSGLTGGPWVGPSSASMAAAAAPYVAWMSTTAEQAKQTATQARSAVAAYEAAFAAHVPPPVIAENHARLAALVATNILGQNTPAIAATEAQYAEMWAQDAAAMFGYAGGLAASTKVTPFTDPPQNTNPAGTGTQAAAVGHAAGTSAAGHSTALSRLVSAVPQVLQGLASGGDPSGSTTGLGSLLSSFLGTGSVGSSIGNVGDFLSFGSGGTFVVSGILFILGPILEGPVIGAERAASHAAAAGLGAGLGGVGAAGASASGATSLGGAGLSGGLGGTGVLAGMGRAASIGGLSVPKTWAGAAPAATPAAAAALPEPTLAAMSEAAPDALGAGYSGMLPAGLTTAAAAGGGGAAGSGWAAQRANAAAQRSSGTSTRYGSRPTVIPQVAREASLHAGTHGQAGPAHQRAQGGEGPLSDNVRDEINELRKQIADLAMERDLLMRSAALWAREAMGR